MGMDTVIELLIAHLNLFREHLDDATITLIDQLRETGEQPDESQKKVISPLAHQNLTVTSSHHPKRPGQ